MPAAPAPTIATSVSPEAEAARAGAEASAAEPAMKVRRLSGMVSELLPVRARLPDQTENRKPACALLRIRSPLA
jgi:hypothetical protein